MYKSLIIYPLSSPPAFCLFMLFKGQEHIYIYCKRLQSNDGIIKFKCVSYNMKYISLWLLT